MTLLIEPAPNGFILYEAYGDQAIRREAIAVFNSTDDLKIFVKDWADRHLEGEDNEKI